MMESTIQTFRDALRDVLGEKFESEVRALVDNNSWYSPGLSVDEVFNLWVAGNPERGNDSLWVFEPLRMGERRFLCEKLGIQRQSIIGKTPVRLSDAILSAAGLPILRVAGNETVLQFEIRHE